MRIMVAEDDAALALFLRKGLELEGHSVQCTADGASALRKVQDEVPDLLVLDLGLPKLDGVEILRSLQATEGTTSVLVLSGRSNLPDRIECLNLGADDYLIKPFSLHELLARCRALARRRVGAASGVLQHGVLRMDRITRAVGYNGTPVELTAKEFTLLEYLLLQRGRAVPRAELLQEVWQMAPTASTNVVDVYVNYLRRKLGAAGGTDVIETMRGEGYAIGAKLPQAKPARGTSAQDGFPQSGVA